MSVLVEKWIAALEDAWRIAVADEKPRDPRRRRAPLFDSHGLHPWSEMVGRINAFQALEPVLIHAGFSPVLMKEEARLAAWDEHVEEVRDAAVAPDAPYVADAELRPPREAPSPEFLRGLDVVVGLDGRRYLGTVHYSRLLEGERNDAS